MTNIDKAIAKFPHASVTAMTGAQAVAADRIPRHHVGAKGFIALFDSTYFMVIGMGATEQAAHDDLENTLVSYV